MSATLTALRAQCRDLLGDLTGGAYVFSDVQVDDWINRAIEQVSIHFPLYVEYTITVQAGVHTYDLENYMHEVISVEYPISQTPPRFLLRKSYTSPEFWVTDGYYDLFKPQTSDSSYPMVLYISDHPTAAGTLNLQVSADHALVADPGDETSILDRHLHLIGLFVRWKAFSERASHEVMDPSPLNTRSSSMELNAQRAEAAYLAALARAIEAEADSAQLSWSMDEFDRIY